MTKSQYNTVSSKVKKEEEEDATLASMKKQGKKKRDLRSNVSNVGNLDTSPAIVLKGRRTRKLLVPRLRQLKKTMSPTMT